VCMLDRIDTIFMTLRHRNLSSITICSSFEGLQKNDS
jgi:hypothetical protein